MKPHGAILKQEEGAVYHKIVQRYKKSEFNVVEVDGETIRTEQDIFNVFSVQLRFPSYFGNNWDAFFDCLTDLLWLKSKDTIILLRNVESIISLPFFDLFAETLVDAHLTWKAWGSQFHVIVFLSEIDEKRKLTSHRLRVIEERSIKKNDAARKFSNC